MIIKSIDYFDKCFNYGYLDLPRSSEYPLDFKFHKNILRFPKYFNPLRIEL
jgi:hypothetical protein